jgi:hypothetical protein
MYPINKPLVIVTFAQDKFDANGKHSNAYCLSKKAQQIGFIMVINGLISPQSLSYNLKQLSNKRLITSTSRQA